MGKPYSLDLRARIIGFIEGGGSRRGAADHFGVSPSCAIKLMDRFRRTGSASPDRRGGSVGKLAAHKDFLLGRVKEKPDITMPELAEALKAEADTEAAPASLSRFLIRHGQRFKKACPRESGERCWPASKIDPTSPGSAMSGSSCTCRACALSPIAWCLSTKRARRPR
jgi:transposase